MKSWVIAAAYGVLYRLRWLATEREVVSSFHGRNAKIIIPVVKSAYKVGIIEGGATKTENQTKSVGWVMGKERGLERKWKG